MNRTTWILPGPADAPLIQELLARSPFVYLAPGSVETQVPQSGVPSCLLKDNGGLYGALVASPAGRFSARLELCALSSKEIAVEAGLETIEQQMAEFGKRWLMVLGAPDWLGRKLPPDYQPLETIIFYERPNIALPASPPLPADICCELVHSDDGSIAGVDEASFDPLWQAGGTLLSEWLEQARYAYTLQTRGAVVAYIIGSVQQQTGHISRLAVTPAWQGRGLGSWLLLKMLRHMQTDGILRTSLNTQASNQRSRRVYERLGFHLTATEVTVIAKPLPACRSLRKGGLTSWPSIVLSI